MRITTQRLQLREYVADDLPAFLAYQLDPRARQFYGADEALPSQLPTLLQTFLDWSTETPRRRWQLAITLREDPATVVGSCGLRLDERNELADLGIDLAPDLWGHGYGTEAARAMLAYGFTSLNLGAVRGCTISANGRVEALVRRLGFRFVRTRPGTEWMTAHGWTYAEWELRADEWRSKHARDRSAGLAR